MIFYKDMRRTEGKSCINTVRWVDLTNEIANNEKTTDSVNEEEEDIDLLVKPEQSVPSAPRRIVCFIFSFHFYCFDFLLLLFFLLFLFYFH